MYDTAFDSVSPHLFNKDISKLRWRKKKNGKFYSKFQAKGRDVIVVLMTCSHDLDFDWLMVSLLYKDLKSKLCKIISSSYIAYPRSAAVCCPRAFPHCQPIREEQEPRALQSNGETVVLLHASFLPLPLWENTVTGH